MKPTVRDELAALRLEVARLTGLVEGLARMGAPDTSTWRYRGWPAGLTVDTTGTMTTTTGTYGDKVTWLPLPRPDDQEPPAAVVPK